jgi:hypothetical protein
MLRKSDAFANAKVKMPASSSPQVRVSTMSMMTLWNDESRLPSVFQK